MAQVLDDDCWRQVIPFLADDPDALFQLLMTNKSFFQMVVPHLYRRPLMDYRFETRRGVCLESILFGYAGFSLEWTLHLPIVDEDLTPVTETTPTPTMTTTIDYMSLVQEMPDALECGTVSQLGEPLIPSRDEVYRAYRQHFATKIKKIHEWIYVGAGVLSIQPCMGWFCNLKELELSQFADSYTFVVPQKTFDLVANLIGTHRAQFPGILQKVHYQIVHWRGDLNKEDFVLSSPKMMLFIRELMGGNWSTDEFLFGDHSGEEQELLKVFQDVDLCNQLRSVKIQGMGFNVRSEEWIPQLSVFLSQCRNLDTVYLSECDARILGWAVDEQQMAAKSDLMSRTGTGAIPVDNHQRVVGSKPRVQWKSITFEQELEDKLVFSEMEQEVYQTMWQTILTGFGHCMESFRYFATYPSKLYPREFPALSIDASLSLPKLRELDLHCPTLGPIATTSCSSLRILNIQVAKVETGGQDEPWLDLRFLPKLEQLRVRQRFGDGLNVKLFGACKRLETIGYGLGLMEKRLRSVAWPELHLLEELYPTRPLKQTSQPPLKKSTVMDNPARYQDFFDQLQSLQTSLSHLTIQNYSELDALDLAGFFQLAMNAKEKPAVVFSKLESICSVRYMKLGNRHLEEGLPALLANLPSSEMFPVLKSIFLGDIECSYQDDYTALWEVLREPLQIASGGSLVQKTSLELNIVGDDHAIEQWESWLKSQGMQQQKADNGVGLVITLQYYCKDVVFLK